MNHTVRTEDQHGHPWLVLNGDPAYKAVKALERLNYSYIVLPSRLLSGLTNVVEGGIIGSTPSEPALRTGDPPPEQSPPAAALVRSVRISDCMAALRREGLV
jgi:hypothetical protein